MQRELKAIDADGHYMEPRDLRPFVERRYRNEAPHVVVGDDNTEEWRGRYWLREGTPNFGNAPFLRPLEDQKKGLAGVTAPGETEAQNRNEKLYGDLHPGAVESKARLEVMDSERIDAAVLYPTASLAWVPSAEIHQALNRGLNDWLAEWCSADPTRLFGATNVVAIHDVNEACREVIRCHEQHRFRAVFLRDALPSADIHWWDRDYDPFWRTCEERQIAVGFHPFPGDTMFGSAQLFDIIGPEPHKWLMRTPFNPIVDAMHTLMGIIVGGVCERFPDLHFAILESGGGWIVPFLERLDTRYEYMGHTVPEMKLKPSDYFRRNWWISFDPEEAFLTPTARSLGSDRIIWGSDYPHPDAFYPGFVEMLDRNIAGLPEEDQARIRGRNAAEFYRL